MNEDKPLVVYKKIVEYIKKFSSDQRPLKEITQMLPNLLLIIQPNRSRAKVKVFSFVLPYLFTLSFLQTSSCLQRGIGRQAEIEFKFV
jgi:hypothetical protein